MQSPRHCLHQKRPWETTTDCQYRPDLPPAERNMEARCLPLYQQRDSQTPDYLTLVFPHREWKCTIRSGRYLPAEGLEEQQWKPMLPIQEVGPSIPDEMA